MTHLVFIGGVSAFLLAIVFAFTWAATAAQDGNRVAASALVLCLWGFLTAILYGASQ
mgnify:CR=1 FL=1